MNTNDTSTCANCGKGEESVGDLKACTACHVVKYCNRGCQVAHRPQHKKACKKRAAELHDEKLFKQPPPKEDCPICMLPLPTLLSGHSYRVCCGKDICTGCMHAVNTRDIVEQKCPFCRTPAPETDEEIIERLKKRTDANDAVAMSNLGCCYSNGSNGLSQDHAKALELWHQAAKLGNATAYYNLGLTYYYGNGVERDDKKANHYYELAAIGGNASARYNLGCSEGNAGNHDRALKHFMIATGGGMKLSLETIQRMFINGDATKDEYSKALRAYQAYLDEIMSPQRDEAAAAADHFKYY